MSDASLAQRVVSALVALYPQLRDHKIVLTHTGPASWSGCWSAVAIAQERSGATITLYPLAGESVASVQSRDPNDAVRVLAAALRARARHAAELPMLDEQEGER